MRTSHILTNFTHTIALIALTVLALVALYLAHPLAIAAGGSRATPDFAAIDKFVETEMQVQHIPGLALGIVQSDQIVYLRGFGVADPAGRAVTPQTPFILGSTTKSFTALAVVQLVEAGQVELDAPVQRYIPWFRVADETASAQITVRQLLNQTSGFSTATGRRENIDFDTSPEALENRIRRLRDVELSQPVGATYQYSNCNYQVLGLIVQTVSGQSFEGYIHQHILAPLDMRNSFTSKEEGQQHGLAMGHRSLFGRPAAFDEPFSRGSLPQGFLISSAEDMSHYLIAHLNEGRYGNTTVLSPAGIAELHQPAVRQGESEFFYGMGWDVGPVNGLPTLSHDGDTFSFHTRMVLVPDSSWGVVTLSNVSNIPGTLRFQGIANSVAGMVAGQQAPVIEGKNIPLIIYGVILGIIILQIAGIIRSVTLFRRWRAQPQSRPQGYLRLTWYIVVPLVLNLAWGLLVWVALPQRFMPLTALLLGIPDLGYILVISGGVALGWGIIRTVWAYFALRQSAAVCPAGTPVTTQ